MNDEDLNEYSLKLSNILSAQNVVILETTSSNVILKPRLINSIVVIEEGKTKKVPVKKKPVQTESKSKEDIITDA